jgi:hypothetical protein
MMKIKEFDVTFRLEDGDGNETDVSLLRCRSDLSKVFTEDYLAHLGELVATSVIGG